MWAGAAPHPQACEQRDALQQAAAVAGQAQRQAAQLREAADHRQPAVAAGAGRAVRLERQCAQVAQLRALAQAHVWQADTQADTQADRRVSGTQSARHTHTPAKRTRSGTRPAAVHVGCRAALPRRRRLCGSRPRARVCCAVLPTCDAGATQVEADETEHVHDALDQLLVAKLPVLVQVEVREVRQRRQQRLAGSGAVGGSSGSDTAKLSKQRQPRRVACASVRVACGYQHCGCAACWRARLSLPAASPAARLPTPRSSRAARAC